MIHFHDTNVIIGYIYSLDPLNKASKRVIFEKNDNYYSEHVKKEVNTISHRKNREYDKFLKKVNEIIKQTNDDELINLTKLHNNISKFKTIGKLDVKNMHDAIDTIWKELNFTENTDAFKVKIHFENFLNNLHSKHRRCKMQCFKKMGFIPAHREKDIILLNKIKEKSIKNIYLHDKDEKILFDVQDYLNKNTNLSLLFVSGDKNFIKAIEILIDVLKFEKYIYLEEYLRKLTT